MDSTPPVSSTTDRAGNADGHLLALILGLLYGLFTLIPDSSTRMVTWPWVALWQATLLLPILWLLWQIWYKPIAHFRLGHGLDWLAGLMVVALVLSSGLADFPQQAIWYSWAALGGLATLYGLVGWLTPQRTVWLLKGQGYLAIAVIVISLLLWVSNIYLPELSRLATLREYGVAQSFNFDLLSLRNGFPLGHQNYVAGYLILILPLFCGLTWHDKTGQRWLWLGGAVLALVALYTTSSRGGLLALLVLVGLALVGLLGSRYVPRRVALPVGIGGIAIALLLLVTNPRVQATVAALRQGQGGGALAYRLITNTVGWRMGLTRPWTGLGLGSVPLAYQRYHPVWGGREAELQYQLHSTPAQLWGELGLWGIGLPLAAAVLLAIALWRQAGTAGDRLAPSLRWSLIAALIAYSVLSLTDYQLDVIAIGGVILIYLAVLIADLRPTLPSTHAAPVQPRRQRAIAGVGVGLVLAMGLWLVPIHRAWAAAAKGFQAIRQDDLQGFVTQLQQAQRLAPWEAYYPLQLGWLLGDLSLRQEPTVAEQMRTDAIAQFQQGNQRWPEQEFGHSNLGWLQTWQDPEAAVASFGRSAEWLPAKSGVFFGLSYSLLLANQPDLAVEAMALELIRHPLTLTSPLWQVDQFATIYSAVLNRTATLCDDLLATAQDPQLIRLLHQIRGTLRWWTGDLAGAADDWTRVGNAMTQAVLAATAGTPVDLDALPELPGKYALYAWYDPANRRQWLETAWVTQLEDPTERVGLTPPPPQIESLVAAMNVSETFDQWLRDNAPSIERRNQRLGFGVLARHDDGLSPADYYLQVINVPIARFFEELVPSPAYLPALDLALQSYREDVLRRLPTATGE